MRRVNVRNGLKQRMNEILGTDTIEQELTVPGITSWSIQAAMLSNLRRIVKAIVGDNQQGRPIRGLWITKTSDQTFNITDGIGLTYNGDAVILEVGVSVTLQNTTPGDRFIYLKHSMGELLEASNSGGKKSSFIGGVPEEIVYDDYSLTQGSNVGDVVNDVIIQKDSGSSDFDQVYLGKITVDEDGHIDTIENAYDRGISTNGDIRAKDIQCDTIEASSITCPTLNNGSNEIGIESDVAVSENVSIAKELTLGTKIIPSVGTEGKDQTITIAAGQTLEFKNGILTSYTPAP